MSELQSLFFFCRFFSLHFLFSFHHPNRWWNVFHFVIQPESGFYNTVVSIIIPAVFLIFKYNLHFLWDVRKDLPIPKRRAQDLFHMPALLVFHGNILRTCHLHKRIPQHLLLLYPVIVSCRNSPDLYPTVPCSRPDLSFSPPVFL